MNTLKAFKTTFATIAAFVLTYLFGHVIMALLFHFEVADWDISKDMDTILHFAFGLPVLYAQIQVIKYANNIKNDL